MASRNLLIKEIQDSQKGSNFCSSLIQLVKSPLKLSEIKYGKDICYSKIIKNIQEKFTLKSNTPTGSRTIYYSSFEDNEKKTCVEIDLLFFHLIEPKQEKDQDHKLKFFKIMTEVTVGNYKLESTLSLNEKPKSDIKENVTIKFSLKKKTWKDRKYLESKVITTKIMSDDSNKEIIKLCDEHDNIDLLLELCDKYLEKAILIVFKASIDNWYQK